MPRDSSTSTTARRDPLGRAPASPAFLRAGPPSQKLQGEPTGRKTPGGSAARPASPGRRRVSPFSPDLRGDVVQPNTQAEHDAEVALRRSLLRSVLAAWRGIPNDLLSYDVVRQLRPRSERYRGVQSIPVEGIIGSVDRYREFDRAFLPKAVHLTDRWVTIRRLALEGRELPPIEVYKVGETYFVKDGNHRVSVAHASNQQYIDAEVIEIDVPVPPQEGDDLKAVLLKGEYADFLEATRLATLRGSHRPILFTSLGRYDILLEHLRVRQYFLGLERKRAVTWDEAVTSWYDDLYLPMIAQIEAANALSLFRNRTEADLYVWMMDHRHYLTSQHGSDPGSHTAVVDFTRRFRPRLSTRFRELLASRRDGVGQ
jgi:hypothetical protein